jgi:hypothetical protein
MPKPDTVLGWNPPDGPTTVVEPSSIKKLLGWLAGERPPAQFFNWFWKKTSQWVDYLDGLNTESLTWTAAHTFEQPITLGAALLTEILATVPRLSFLIADSDDAGRTMLWGTSTPGLLGARSRLQFYATNAASNSSVGWEAVLNADFNGTSWVRLVSGSPAMIVKVTQTGAVFIARRPSGAASWTDTYDAAGWSEIIAAFAGAGSPATINGDLGIGGDVVLVGNYGQVGNMGIVGSFDASDGAERHEHRAYKADFVGGSGFQVLRFESDADISAAAVANRLYRPESGKVTKLVVWLQLALSADVTIRVYKNGDTGTILGSVTIEAGQTYGAASFSSGNTFAADDYLSVDIGAAGAAVVTSCDVGAIVRTRS